MARCSAVPRGSAARRLGRSGSASSDQISRVGTRRVSHGCTDGQRRFRYPVVAAHVGVTTTLCDSPNSPSAELSLTFRACSCHCGSTPTGAPSCSSLSVPGPAHICVRSAGRALKRFDRVDTAVAATGCRPFAFCPKDSPHASDLSRSPPFHDLLHLPTPRPSAGRRTRISRCRPTANRVSSSCS